MNDDITQFLFELIGKTDPLYRGYAETAHSYYSKHGHLTDGLIKSVQTNAYRQGRKVPKGLSNRPDIDEDIEKAALPETLCITIGLDTDPTLLRDLALILKRLAKRNDT